MFVGIQLLPGAVYFGRPEHEWVEWVVPLGSLNIAEVLIAPRQGDVVDRNPRRFRIIVGRLGAFRVADLLRALLLVVLPLRGASRKSLSMPLFMGLNLGWIVVQDSFTMLNGYDAQCYLFSAFSILGILMTLFPFNKPRLS
ncbi:MAG: hypothetical protein QM811_06155 [Pirellulales bacterium]